MPEISDDHHDKRNITIAIILLMIAGAFVRMYGLGEWDYYHDEIWHVYVAKQPTLATAA